MNFSPGNQFHTLRILFPVLIFVTLAVGASSGALPISAADSRVRIPEGGTSVHIWNGTEWVDSGMRPPPGHIIYRAGLIDEAGNLAVLLGGWGRGFNVKLANDGPTIVANRIQWKDSAPEIVDLSLPGDGSPGFIGTDADGKSWRIVPPEPGRRSFVATPYAKKAAYFPLSPVTPEQLAEAIQVRIGRVAELKVLAQLADARGLRAYLFGGTAAAFAHYVKWELLGAQGAAGYRDHAFDYEYAHIYRHNQDLDIVVARRDGQLETPEDIEAFTADVLERFPYGQGEKSEWEVRPLRATLGVKAALLGNSDFNSQHSDSNSTSLIELTEPIPGEPRVRDLRFWGAPRSVFLEDVANGEIHYYFSEGHPRTSRAQKGLNPPILSAIRYLTKAFQYGLDVDDVSLSHVRRIVSDFDPSTVRPGYYVGEWIEKNGKKLLNNAVDLEAAWNRLDELGLREKLIAIRKKPEEAGSLAWYLAKEPLRSQANPRGYAYPVADAGRTAGELGIDVMTHATRTFQAYESITRSPRGRPNLFISRPDAEGEGAWLGAGLYTLKGTEPKKDIGSFAIRLKVDPSAREGVDFIWLEQYNIVLWRTSSKLTLIPDGFRSDMPPMKVFEYLVDPKNAYEEGAKYRIARSVGKLTLSANETAAILAKTMSLVDARDWKALQQLTIWPEANRILGDVMRARGIGLAELLEIKESTRGDEETELALIRLLYPMTKTSAEFVRVMRLNDHRHADLGKSAVAMRLCSLVTESLDHFLSLNPTLVEMKLVEHDSVYYLQFFPPFLRKAIRRAKSTADYFSLTAFVYESPSAEYREVISRFVLSSISDFLRLKPTPEDFVMMAHKRLTYRDWVPFQIATIRAAENAGELVARVHTFPAPIGDAVRNELDGHVLAKFEDLMRTGATLDQIRSIESCMGMAGSRALHALYRLRTLPPTATQVDLIAILKATEGIHTTEGAAAVEREILTNPRIVAWLAADIALVKQVESLVFMHVASIETLWSIGLGAVKGASDLQLLTDTKHISPSTEFTALRRSFYIKYGTPYFSQLANADDLLKLTPKDWGSLPDPAGIEMEKLLLQRVPKYLELGGTVQGVKVLERYFYYVKSTESLWRLALPHCRTPQDFIELTASIFHPGSDDYHAARGALVRHAMTAFKKTKPSIRDFLKLRDHAPRAEDILFVEREAFSAAEWLTDFGKIQPPPALFDPRGTDYEALHEALLLEKLPEVMKLKSSDESLRSVLYGRWSPTGKARAWAIAAVHSTEDPREVTSLYRMGKYVNEDQRGEFLRTVAGLLGTTYVAQRPSPEYFKYLYRDLKSYHTNPKALRQAARPLFPNDFTFHLFNGAQTCRDVLSTIAG